MGGFIPSFIHVDKEGDIKCTRLSTRGGEGVKIGQNLVHVVVECPLRNCYSPNYVLPRLKTYFDIHLQVFCYRYNESVEFV